MIADGADQIQNAFYNKFESAKLDIMCYAHVIRNCRKRPFSSNVNKESILSDIALMQLSPNRTTFDMLKDLFIDKWTPVEPDFAAYFEKEWLGSHSNWFEGAADYTASHNNSQESHNAVIKRKITLRKRLPLNQFMHCMKTMAQDISSQFSKNERRLEVEPNIPKKVYESAAVMVKENFIAFKAKNLRNASVHIYSVPSSRCETPTERFYKDLVKSRWESFDDFIVHGYQQFYVVKISIENWKIESTCTCTAFFKQHMCKHIIALGIRIKLIELPASANPVRIAATKKQRGRPKAAAKTLIMQ